MTHRDTCPPILFWLQSRITALIIESFAWFFFFKGKICQLAISGYFFLYAWPDGTFGDKTVQNKEVSLCSISSLHCFSDINISAHANSVSEPRNWDTQWWQPMREAPRAWLAWSQHLGPVWLDIQIRLWIFLFGYSLYERLQIHYCCYYFIITIIVVLIMNTVWNTCILPFTKYPLKYYLYDLCYYP